jgi:hypothetical protein
VQAGQPGACLFDQGGELLVRGLLARVDALEVDDELQRDAFVPKRPPPSTCSSAAIASIVTDRLCGSIPITTQPLLLTAFSCLRLDGVDWSRRAPLLPAGHSLLQPLPPAGGRGSACQMRVTRRTWTAAKERPPRPPQPSLGQDPIFGQWN